ncbi:hypothetical protein F4780DRAFT_225418 [Xylariomycetidae sp. FL0641]|nr:hypothetical protein F4780DRAFT_225418 [Xylariomycetidae sp. FL0641]
MASYSTQYYTTGVPIPSSRKDGVAAAAAAHDYYGYGGGRGGAVGGYGGYDSSAYSVSPPESAGDATSSGGPSYSHGPTHSGGSVCDEYGNGGAASAAPSASGVDFNDYMQDRFADSFDPIPLDRSLARQAQTSGNLNAKHRELMDLQAKAQARLAKTRARFADGLQDAQEVRANLEWTSKKVSSMKKKAEKKHTREYQKARERYPSPEY